MFALNGRENADEFLECIVSMLGAGMGNCEIFLNVLNALHRSCIHVWVFLCIWRISRFILDLLKCKEHSGFLVEVPIDPILLGAVKSF